MSWAEEAADSNTSMARQSRYEWKFTGSGYTQKNTLTVDKKNSASTKRFSAQNRKKINSLDWSGSTELPN